MEHKTRSAHDVPVFVNCRDRVSSLRLLVSWLERAGHERIHLVDNDSTYEPLLEYYETTPHTVVRLGANCGHLAPWTMGVIEHHARGPYVVTDPDVVPTEECPPDAVARLLELLDRHPGHVKAGLGLVIDDLPDHYALKDYVRGWEAQHWQQEIEPGVFSAPVDTTFAAYPAGLHFAKRPALRSGAPYVARHLPWYVDNQALSDEESYYRAHARGGLHSTWNTDELPARLDWYFHRSLWARLRRRVRALRAER